MKRYIDKIVLCTVMFVAVVIQSMATVTTSAAETLPTYRKMSSFNYGVQGKDGWYYMYKDITTDEYVNMTWNGTKFKGKSDSDINNNFIMPGNGIPSVIGFEVPYTGIVKLKVTNDIMYRASSNAEGGDVVLTLKLNDNIIKMSNGEDTQWIFKNTYNNSTGNTKYNIENVSVKKGDMIYHEVDCGNNTASADVYWQPEVIYTSISDPDYYESTEASRISGEGTTDAPYIITSVSDYKVFADIVNSENPSACAKLTSDIVWNSNTPQLVNFSGTIDGNNHKVTLRGYSLIKSATDGAVIRNLTLDGAVKEESNAAAFIGSIDSGEVIIKKCANIASVSATGNNAAGFIGCISNDGSAMVENSFNYGTVVSGGNTADAFANSDVDGNVVCEGDYYLIGSVKNNNSTVIASQHGTKASAEKFASGEIAYELNNRAGDIVFGQMIGEDKFPVGITDGTKVVYKSGNVYENKNGIFAVIGTDCAAFCASQDAFMAIADYDAERMVSILARELKKDSVYRTDLSEISNNIERKMFVWNSVEEIVPLCDVITYEAVTEVPEGTELMTISFDGKETTCPVMIVDEYPSMRIRDIAKIVGGTSNSKSLTIGDVNLEYTANERLAKYNDGHLMLMSVPKLLNGELYIPISSLMPTTGWTVEYKRFENEIIIETGTNYPEPQATVYAKDYETVVTDNDDDRDTVIKAFKAAAALAESGIPTKLEFEEKTYHISEKQDSFALFDLDNLSNLTIEGNGCTFVFERPTNSLINIEGCTNIKVNNITVEYDERVIIYGSITSKDVDNNTINIVIPEDSPLPADNQWAYWFCTSTSEGPWIFGYPMNAEKDIPGFAPYDALRIKSVENVSGREYKILFSESFKDYDSSLKIGDRFAFKSCWTAYDLGASYKYGRPDFLFVNRSKDITFDGIKTNGSLLMFAPVSYCDGRITFRNCEMKPTDGDLITSAADGIHASTNRFGIIVDNCNLSNSFDDLINTETYGGNVERKPDEYTFETSRDMYCSVGDEIRFFDTVNHQVIGRAFLTAIEKSDSGKYILRLDRIVDGVVSAEESDNPTAMYNMNAANNGNIIKNSTLANSRRHAYIVRSENSLIDNNRMENNAGAATEMANEIYGESNEGLFPSAMTFRNNVVQSEGISSRYIPLKAYSWYARTGEQKAIDGVLIENNTIDVPSKNGSITINSVNGLYMLNNTIKNSGEFENDVIPVKISNSKIEQIDGLDLDYKQNVTSVISISESDVDADDIKNINIKGNNTATPYSIK